MQFEAALKAFSVLHSQYGPVLDSLLLLFFRMLAYATTGPIFNRKNIPMLLKISAAIYFTGTLGWMIAPDLTSQLSPHGQLGPYLLQLVMNIVVGALLGYISDLILQSAYAAGNFMNNQIGLSSAMMMDPSSGKQVMLLEGLFSNLTVIIFLYLGGLHWMIRALKRSLELFPLHTVQQPITHTIDLSYLILLSGNILNVGVQLVAPVMLVTMCVDLMLGIMNRTAQQMPVFQLSASLKPAIGIGIMVMTLSTFLKCLTDYLNDYSRLF